MIFVHRLELVRDASWFPLKDELSLHDACFKTVHHDELAKEYVKMMKLMFSRCKKYL